MKARNGSNASGVGRKISLIQRVRQALSWSNSRKRSPRKKVNYYDAKKLQLFFAEFDVKYKLARG